MHHQLLNVSKILANPQLRTATPYDYILTAFLGFSTVATIILNGLIITVYLKNPLLRNSFKTYIVNLSIAEVLLALTGMSGNFISAVYGYWPLDSASCTLVIYGSRIFGSGIRYGHVIITLNRLWAVMFPLHYKRHHSLYVAYVTIVVSWIVVHIIQLPVIIPGRVWIRDGEDKCALNVDFQRRAAIAVEALGFTVAEGLIICLCPIVWYKVRKWNHDKPEQARPVSRQEVTSKTKEDSASIIDQDIKLVRYNSNDSIVQFCPNRPTAAGQSHVVTCAAQRIAPQEVVRTRLTFSKRSVAHNRLLMYFFLAIVLCWTPNNVYWLMVDTAGYWNGTFNLIQAFALYAHSWINPIISYIALERLRVAVNKLLGC